MILHFSYGKNHLEFDLPQDKILSVLEPKKVTVANREVERVSRALCNPISDKTLSKVASKSRSVSILVSDYTRAVPSRILIPPILEQLRMDGQSSRDVRILVANGLHKPAPKSELEELLGEAVMEECEVINHDAEDEAQLEYVGRTSFGTDVSVNKCTLESDLIIMTGLIEPHFFAGYSGGRKSILPGVASRDSIYQNHSYRMIAHPMSHYGVLDENPIHQDINQASRMVVKEKSYIVNVVLDKEGRIAKVFAGDVVQAYRVGVEYLNMLVRVKAPRRSGIVITSNGGYPLDRDLYQAVKGMATGRIVVEKGGAIIIFSECIDGIGRGHELFRKLMTEAKSPDEVLERIRREEPIKDQWEAQILAQILMRANVILVSNNIKHSIVEEMHMIPASSPEEALELAEKIVGKEKKVIVIPEGPYVIPTLTE